MSDIFFKRTTPVAKKSYPCDACYCINDAWNKADIDALPENERIDYELAKLHGFKILPGEIYVKQPQVYDGHFGTFRAIPSMVDLCHKYELFNED